jgi:hypothetical protein
VPFGVVAVQQPLGSPAADLGSQFPAEVEGVLDAEVEALSAYRRVDVCRVASQQHATAAVALGLPGGVAEAGEPARRVYAEVGASELPQPLLELLEGRRCRAVLGHLLGARDEAVHPLRVRGGTEAQMGVRISAATAASSSGGAATSTSPSSHSILAGSPGKPIASSLRTVLRPPSQPTR